jgi:glycosyltransferase involved in cell wall biosynthesis
MPLISLAMIVKNEEATLVHCLESVRPLVDEMVIVDTGSTDSTIEIASGFGAQVRHFQWCDDFAAARNESLKYCKGEWVLILDADEAIDPLDYEKIKSACLNPTADAYDLVQRNYVSGVEFNVLGERPVANKSAYSEGKTIPYYSDNNLFRLARLFDGLVYTGRVHETFELSVAAHGRTIAHLDAVIHHYGKLLVGRDEHKTQYYLFLAAKEAEKNPTFEKAQFNLLQQAVNAKQWELALKAAQARIKLNANVEPFVLFGKGWALQELGRHEEAIFTFDLLLYSDPKHVYALAHKAISLVATGEPDAARRLMSEAIGIDPSFYQGFDYMARMDFLDKNYDGARKMALNALSIVPQDPSIHDLLMQIELARGDYGQAAQDALLGIRSCPDGGYPKWREYLAAYYRNATELELRNNNPEAVRKLALEAIEIVPDEPGYYDLLLRMEAANGNHPQAAQYALLGIENCPNSGNGMWHRLAAVYLASTGNLARAKAVLEAGLDAFPDDPDLARLNGMIC